MNMLIEKVKISNFLSFLGEYEVNLKPYTVIMCNFYEGKDDFFRAFEFVFGASLSDLRVENPLDLVHKVLREEFLINRKVRSYVEVTFTLLKEKKQLKFTRGVKNGVNNSRIEHKISDLVTSHLLYEEKLSSLGVHIKQKNLIYYKSYFNSAIWGTTEDLERTICTCLRENYLFDDWKKAYNEVEYLTKLKSQAALKDYNSMKKSHSVIAKYTKKFEAFSSRVETLAWEIMETFRNDSSSEGTSSLIASTKEDISEKDVHVKRPDVLGLESKIHILSDKLDDLKLKEALLTSHLHHEEIKLAVKPVNVGILQTRISVIKAKIQKKELRMSEIWAKIQEVESQLGSLSEKICFALASLQDMEIRKFRQNRFTQYGRFCDYLQPSRYVQLLKHIIGNDIFYAHLCDTTEDAFALVKQIKHLKYEHREVFLPLRNYSHRLKDLILASGERGIQINTLEELLIFLCKLKHYKMIDEVPTIVQRDFNFEGAVPKDYIIYIRNNFYFESDGLISFKYDANDFFLETEAEIEKNLIQLYTEQEMNYHKWDDLIFSKWKTLIDMNSLEEDVFCLKRKWRKSIQKPHLVREASLVMEIYQEYRDIFKEHAEEREKYESELQQEEETLLSQRESSMSSNEESVSLTAKELEDIITEKRKTRKELEDLTHELHILNVKPILGYLPRRNVFIFESNVDKTRFFFEEEFKKLKKLMKEDDLEDFLGSQEWRTHFFASLGRDFEEIKAKLKTSAAELQNIATTRKKRLYKLFDHCSRYLTSTFGHILDGALPFLKLNFGPGEEEIHIMTCLGEEKINVVDIKHFNTLLKFISVFSIFLEIAKFDKIPFMVIDDIEEYFPLHSDNLTAVLDMDILGKILPQNENPRFHLLMRLGQFLRHYIKKNNTGKPIRNNGHNTDYTNGPTQIICLAKEDFILTGEHYLWIQNQLLPEEYLSENCNSYSGIYEINFEHGSN